VELSQKKLDALMAVCNNMLKGRGWIPAGLVRRLAGQVSWISGIIPQLRPFGSHLWRALAAQSKAQREQHVYVRQVSPALDWILKLAEGYEAGISRSHRVADRTAEGIYFEFDASLWGGGGALWPGEKARMAGDPPAQYWHLKWTRVHEVLASAAIGEPGSQATWEAFTMLLCVKIWVDHTLGPITAVGDAEGIIYDLVQMRAKSTKINNIAKEMALHLAPLGRELSGIHVWGERNSLADKLSRVARDGGADILPWLRRTSRNAEILELTDMNFRFLG
jgi:hypothetical protein